MQIFAWNGTARVVEWTKTVLILGIETGKCGAVFNYRCRMQIDTTVHDKRDGTISDQSPKLQCIIMHFNLNMQNLAGHLPTL